MIEYLKVLKKIETAKKNLYIKQIKILFLCNFNQLFLENYLNYFLLEKNINVKFINSGFDQIDQTIIHSKKKIDVDYLIVADDLNTSHNFNYKEFDNYLIRLELRINHLNLIIDKNPKLKVIYFNLVKKIDFRNDFYNKINDKILNFNHRINKKCLNEQMQIFDIQSITNLVGLENFYDEEKNYLAKTLYSEYALNVISKELAKQIYVNENVRKKCLVLDLDNTLWGGVLGEEGPFSIKLGNSFQGEKFTKFQKYIKDLLNKGVILAILSKNNLDDVRQCFKKNTNMILNFSDFTSYRINWREKYLNINEIALELNIGKDSIVFFDDSKFERDQMKKMNPEINVIDVPNDVSNYIESIEDTGYFLSQKIINEDIKKKDQYQIVTKFNRSKAKFKDTESFLKSLKMKLRISKINNKNFDRCVQMSNKTNQFNLTNLRFTQNSLKNYLKKNKTISLVGSLEDKFGNHGITSMLIARQSKKKYIIESFLLSCRIFGRKVENTLLVELIKKIKNKTTILNGVFIKSKKNQEFVNFYIDNGFKKKSNKIFESKINKNNYKKNQLFKIIYEKN
jgi:FkbH-like protein